MHTIAIDAMGGDNAPKDIIAGAVQAISADTKIILVGKEDIIAKELANHNYNKAMLEIVNATEVIETHEAALAVRQKKDSSIAVGINLLKEGTADSFISAGSTGALLAGATLKLKRIPGIDRPALATMLPSKSKFTLLLDCGANVDSKPHYLEQFAHLGSLYMQHVQGITAPKVGLVNIGTEKEKGNTLTKEATTLLEATSLNFVGNIEARDIAFGKVDVAVCDGFVGNVVLKTTEGYSKFILETIKTELKSSPISTLGALLAKGAFANVKKSFDYSEVGGAPFLGLTSLVIKTHGSATAKDIVGATKQAKRFKDNNMIEKLKTAFNNEI